MAIPKHDEIRVPAMQILQSRGQLKLREFLVPLAEHFKLTEEEVNTEYPSGNGLIFYDRISWALSYLRMSNLLEKPARATYQLSPKGTELLQTPQDISAYIDEQIAAKKNSSLKKDSVSDKSNTSIIESSSQQRTPQEELYKSFEDIRTSVYSEIISTILTKSPFAFEKLVVHLLQKMGYGGEIKNSGLVTQRSNDGGIDGIIKEDVLGLGRIHIQAKRYNPDNSVKRDEIQKFVGALAVAQSNKGVFITTSSYSKGAIEYANNLNGSTALVLIDGNQLGEYIYDFGLGMQVEQTIEIKRLDAEYWDGLKDDENSKT